MTAWPRVKSAPSCTMAQRPCSASPAGRSASTTKPSTASPASRRSTSVMVSLMRPSPLRRVSPLASRVPPSQLGQPTKRNPARSGISCKNLLVMRSSTGWHLFLSRAISRASSAIVVNSLPPAYVRRDGGRSRPAFRHRRLARRLLPAPPPDRKKAHGCQRAGGRCRRPR